MKAITICQPYAHLIITGAKRIENRTWATRYRGPLLIHAGKSRSWLDLGGRPERDCTYGIELKDMAFGAIVGRANLIDCLGIDAIRKGLVDRIHPWAREHEHAEGPCCFLLDRIERFQTPIPYRGAQGFFDVPDSLLPEFVA